MSNSTIREELVDMTCNAGYTTKGCAVYSIDAIIDILVSEGMTEEDAFDHFYYNIDGSHMGEFTPIYINTI
jgi:hypothetical protein